MQFGDGTLGVIKTYDGSWSYQLDWDDILWAARMLVGEAGREAGTSHGAAILWCQASRLYMFRNSSLRTYKSLIRAHSQPINPKWLENGQFCMPGGRNHGTSACSAEKLARRVQIQGMAWDTIPDSVRTLVLNWARGMVDNPVAKAVDFAQPAVANKRTSRHPGGRVNDGYFGLVWDSKGHPEGSDSRNSNGFYKVLEGRHKSDDWPPNFLRIVWDENESAETTPEVLSSASPGGPSTRSRDDENRELTERMEGMTSGRTEPPDIQFPYAIVYPGEPDDVRDKNAGGVIDSSRDGNVLSAPIDRFFAQMSALQNVSNYDIAQAVPVLAVYVSDEDGAVINLNDLIFSKPANIFEENNTNTQNAERPIASIDSFSVKVQSPSVGGPTGISIATLTLKIHNPWLVNDLDPVGKYISYMFRQGYFMRVRYGSSKFDEPTSKAFQYIEENFFISQQEISTADDLSMKLKLTLMPASTKLFGQILIGESVPVSQISQEDANAAIQSAIPFDATSAQRSQLASDVLEIRSRFNGIVSEAVNYSNGHDGTFRSSLHGAISNFDVINQYQRGRPNVRVDNLMSALKTIQARVLTSRYEEIFKNYAYRFVSQNATGLGYAAVNFGTLTHAMIRPEIESVVKFISQNQTFNVGPTFSSDVGETSATATNRNLVDIVFGNFNSYAGQWSNKPISSFPVNIEAVLDYLKQERAVGKFSDTLNSFLSRINAIISDGSNFVVDGTEDRLELPQIKYAFYPHPLNSSRWIFYFYDNKDRVVQFTKAMEAFDTDDVPKEQAKAICEQFKIPWIEFGSKNSVVRSMQGSTTGDDLISSRNLYQANNAAFTQRNRDASAIPSGLSREFINGMQTNPNEIINNHILIMPLKVSVDHYIVPAAYLFSPIYLFFQMKTFTGIFTIQELSHQVKNGTVSTNMTLMIQITRANRQRG